MSRENEGGKSVGFVVVGLAAIVAYGGWAFLAAEFFQNDPRSPGGKADFWGNSIEQLSNFASVISYGMRERLWMLILVGVLEVGVIVLWVVMKKLEKELWAK